LKIEVEKAQWFFLLAALISLINYCYELQYLVNIPITDDYLALLDKYAKYQEANSLGESLAVLFSPFNIHYTILTNLIVGILAWLEAPVNFYWLAALGMLVRLLSFWVAIWIISHIKIERDKLSLVALCGALFFFQPKAWQSTHWVLMTLYGNLPWLFGFLAIAVANSRILTFGKLCAAILLSAMAALAGTPGIPTILFVALLIFLRSSNMSSRVVVSVSTVVILLIFAYLMSVSAAESTAEINLRDRFQDTSLLIRFIGLAVFFFQLLGGYWTTLETPALILGIFGSGITCLLLVHFFLRKDFGVVILILYSINASLIVSIGRFGANEKLAFEWRFFTFTEIYWLVLIISSLAFASTAKHPAFKKVIPVAAIMALLYTSISHYNTTPEMESFSRTLEREIVELAIGQDGLFEDFWLGPAFTAIALKHNGSTGYNFEQSMSEYTKAEPITSCSESIFKIMDNDFDILAGDKFDPAYVKLQAFLRGSQVSECRFLACDDDASFSFDATIYQDQSSEPREKDKYIVTAVIDKKYQKSVNQLRCAVQQ
jgi:hypothetical protein